MKTTLFVRTTKSLSFFVLVSLLLVSCKKNEKEITTDDAADVVSYALESSSGGMADQLKDCTEEVNDELASWYCGSQFDTTLSVSYTGTVIGAYSTQRHYTLNCNGSSVATDVSCTGSYSGNYDAPRMSSTNSGTLNWQLSGLDAGSTQYVFNGAHNRSGSHTSKVRNKYTFNTSLSVSSSNVTVDKTTGKIVSGSGNITLTCDVVDGDSYYFTGTIVYNANETATVVINGTTYTVTLY